MNLLYGWIDQKIDNIDFKIKNCKKEKILSYSDFLWDESDIDDYHYIMIGKYEDILATWTFLKKDDSLRVNLAIDSKNMNHIESISPLIFDYYPERPVDEIRFMYFPKNGLDNPCGTFRLDEIKNISEPLNSPSGAFYNHCEQGLFISTIIPQKNMNKICFNTSCDHISWEITTDFNLSIRQNTFLRSETVYITTQYSVLKAFERYAENYPLSNPAKRPVKGWSSWDYYFSTVRMEDIDENMEALERMPFKEEIEIVSIDDGWQYLWGEWKLNYKFPQTFCEVGKKISERGYTPGIWTAPAEINETTYIAYRRPEMLVKNEFADPYKVPETGNFLIDPTVPESEQYLRELFTELYDAKFRFFKIDYVSSFLNQGLSFYNKEMGVYDVIRRLFEIIRESVKESHILGCSLPPEAGPWIADSGRVGYDIHNQWTHAKWAVECYMYKFWMQNRIWINDIDYLVIRGKKTCTEGGLNVVDHNLNNRERPRWRKGDVFNNTEAETWKNIVMMSGSNLFLSDRLSTINETGLELIENALNALPISAYPIDLSDRPLPSFWLQQTGDLFRLTVINWENTDVKLRFPDKNISITPPQKIFTLKAHGSTVVTWKTK